MVHYKKRERYSKRYLDIFRHRQPEQVIQVVDRESVCIHDDDPIVFRQLEHVETFVTSLVIVVGQMLRQAGEVSKNSALTLPDVEHFFCSIVVGRIRDVDEIVGRIDEHVVHIKCSVSY